MPAVRPDHASVADTGRPPVTAWVAGVTVRLPADVVPTAKLLTWMPNDAAAPEK